MFSHLSLISLNKRTPKFVVLIALSFFLFSSPDATAEKVKNIIFMIGDGMGYNHLHLTQELSQKKLFMFTLPHQGIVFTASADNPVTDSAAAATALATGYKTTNHTLGKDAQGKDQKTILEILKGRGLKTGLVTTTDITDATPAGFAAHVHNRKEKLKIAEWYLKNHVDLLLGGGKKHFLDLTPQFKKDQYLLVYTPAELSALHRLQGKKLLGLFHPSDLNYEMDREEIPEMKNEPPLSTMAQKALELLAPSPKGFFLMIEGGRIDHAAHALDMATLSKEILEFDKAIQAVYQFSKKRKDTLLIITADHETAGLSMPETTDYAYLNSQTISFNQMVRGFKKESITQVLSHYAKLTPTQEEINMIEQSKDLEVHERARVLGSLVSKKAGLTTLSLDMFKVGNTHGHTSSPVPIFSFGPQAEVFQGGQDNTDIPKKILRIIHAPSH
ncbi:MAG: hypothetical protein A2Z91_01130 [Deltaproteobacteria bacterium GWA2_38_16]|nr:MAG: hypothetical protein A2Z91_01130 [Deltaproteobacteria bacterium GWA2_38_16]OGQ02955.1 MAG: hypothetical protein A3D19_00900 [Deltaproteobacteria bacterium RIFCSPHIGHO2_02_FULL_38_15]OGQ60672.1 MAG: hypothetical protein A3G92_03750 [Deltaproteobacteria bacterium RIFCSPLOWO2_12_FULL_38_8]